MLIGVQPLALLVFQENRSADRQTKNIWTLQTSTQTIGQIYSSRKSSSSDYCCKNEEGVQITVVSDVAPLSETSVTSTSVQNENLKLANLEEDTSFILVYISFQVIMYKHTL